MTGLTRFAPACFLHFRLRRGGQPVTLAVTRNEPLRVTLALVPPLYAGAVEGNEVEEVEDPPFSSSQGYTCRRGMRQAGLPQPREQQDDVTGEQQCHRPGEDLVQPFLADGHGGDAHRQEQ